MEISTMYRGQQKGLRMIQVHFSLSIGQIHGDVHMDTAHDVFDKPFCYQVHRRYINVIPKSSWANSVHEIITIYLTHTHSEMYLNAASVHLAHHI